jgi:hypothetical protein
MAKKIKIISIGLLFVLSIALSYYLGFCRGVLEINKPLKVDFRDDKNSDIGTGPILDCSVSLYYLYGIESKKCKNYKQYYDTLTYCREDLVYYDVQDTNFLMLYKSPDFFYQTYSFFGFTKNKFFWFKPTEMILKNFPVKYSKRYYP